MKKKVLIVIVILIILILSILQFIKIRNKNVNLNIIDTINKNSNLPVQYMSKYNKDDQSLSNYKILNNYMSVDYNDSDIKFSYYGYPNDESDYYLGSIELLTDKYDILNVKINDDVKLAISKLEEYGFKIKNNDEYYIITFELDDYTIKITSDIENQDRIESIELKVKSKYLGHKLY